MIANITAPLAIGQASDYYTLRAASGFGSASVALVKWDRPGFHGVKIPKSFWRERIMRLTVGVKAADSATYETKRRDLQAALDTPRAGNTLFKFTTQGGLLVQSYAHLNTAIQAPFYPGEVTIGEFRIELVAEDPLFYSQTLTETDVTIKLPFGTGSGVVANAGNAAVYPVIRILGAVTDPIITNTTTGKTVSLTGITIAAGEYIDIDMFNETVVDQAGASKYSYLLDDTFFTLEAGNNTITISGTAGGSGDRKITASFRSGYIGI